MEAGDDTLKRIIGDQHIAGTEQYSLWDEVLVHVFVFDVYFW